jgi:hypothetical protein
MLLQVALRLRPADEVVHQLLGGQVSRHRSGRRPLNRRASRDGAVMI